jgi:hypothetical protein
MLDLVGTDDPIIVAAVSAGLLLLLIITFRLGYRYGYNKATQDNQVGYYKPDRNKN